MRAKKLFALLLAGSMMASVLTGCWGGKKDDSSSGTDGDSDITWTDPDYDEDEDAPVAEYTIAVDVGDYGTVKPASPIKVKAGDTATFTVTANEGWLISGIQIDNKDQPSSGPAETLKVSLDKVSANHTVTVKYEAKTFTVSATVNDANYGSAVVGDTSVAYKGTATVTVTPAPYYVVDTVTATMGDTDANVTGSDNTYTVENVTGDVTFNVTFKEASVKEVSISGTPTKSYKIGESFSLSGLTATVTYEANSGTKDITLSEDDKNVTVTIDGVVGSTFSTAGSYTVTVKYTVGDKTGEATYSDITVNALDKEDVEKINGDFTTAASTWSDTLGNTLTVGKNSDNLLTKAKEAATKGEQTFTVKTGYVWKTDYKFEKVVVSGPDYNKQISDFFSDTVKKDLKYSYWPGGYKSADVYIEVDQQSGSCTMWVIWVD